MNSLGGIRKELQVADRPAFLLLPQRGRGDGTKPWVWYAPTFTGLHPASENVWMLSRLLARGRAVAGLDVGESFGNPEGRAHFTAFHKLLVREYGLAEKVGLLAQSRGALMLYNWAAEHPEPVACIAGIFPVCDLTSYPGLAEASKAYGMTEAELARDLPAHNPIERLAPLAAHRVPILHIHGDKDAKVPLEANTAELARRYRALGGEIEVIVIPGRGHEVCPEFFQEPRLVDFLATAGNRP